MRDFHFPGRSAVHAMSGMCATSHPLAAQVAIRVLQQGGNAVDAAIAGAAVLAIAEPSMAGLGGDCFALIKPPGSENVLGINGSGRAPAAISAANLRTNGLTTIPSRGIEAVTFPGAVDAFCKLNHQWGRMALADTLAPAISYAQDGIPTPARVAQDWARFAPVLKGNARQFFLNNDKPLAEGDIFRAPEQAEVLRRIAQEGRAGFYEGEVAAAMIATLQAAGGTHQMEDLATIQADWTTPIASEYRGIELLEHPPNGQGAVAILILKILSHFNLQNLDPLGPERAHLEIEAARLAHDARNRFLGETAPRLDHLLADRTAAALARLIDPNRAMTTPAPLSEAIHRDTVYITVVDRDRMAVSLIFSIYFGFGSGIACDKFGFLFQNRGAGFNLTPGHINEIGPGKRPVHTIIPAMTRHNGRVNLTFGVMGGGYQPSGHARILSNLRDFGMDLQTAIDSPRCFAGPEAVELEPSYPDLTRQALMSMGHRVIPTQSPLGGAQGILIGQNGVLTGGSDPRKDGIALGY